MQKCKVPTGTKECHVSNDAIAHEFGHKLVVCNGRLFAAPYDHCKVFQILQELLVRRNRLSLFLGDKSTGYGLADRPGKEFFRY